MATSEQRGCNEVGNEKGEGEAVVRVGGGGVVMVVARRRRHIRGGAGRERERDFLQPSIFFIATGWE